MRYSLLAGGKRLRPKMLMAVLEGYGCNKESGAELAAALEMIHTYSLIHDDLPAMDNDDLRRGRPTCHKQFDEATAILAGDGLLTYAFKVVSRSKLSNSMKYRAVEILSDNAGAAGMVLGQCLDLEAEHKELDFDQLKTVHFYKTGCLFSAALMLGALAAGRSEEVISFWEELGKEIGLAFQIQDDILDVESTPEQLGKTNSDARNGKNTSVSILGIEEAENLMNNIYSNVINKIESCGDFDGKPLILLLKDTVKRTF